MLRLPFDSYMPIALFSVCHFVGRWNEVFGHSLKNSKVYGFSFLGIVLLLGLLSMLRPQTATLRNRLVVAIVVPYIASVIAYFFSLAAFYLESGARSASFPAEGAVLALFFPYIASAAWQISVYVIIWAVLDSYRRMSKQG